MLKTGLTRTTMARMYWDLMELDTTDSEVCEVCGRSYPLNRHHIVPRSAGELYKDGEKVSKPLITLCGFGNNLYDMDGRMYCHGAAHSGRLHFRNNHGQREYLFTEPMKYQKALEMEGWRPC